LLDQGAKTVGELAAESGASVRGLIAILNALVGLEFLVRKGTCYALTPESAAFLVSTKPAYYGGFFQHMSRQLMPNWLQLTEAVRTGQPVVAANRQGEGQQFFAEFVEGLFPLSYKAAQVVGEHLGIPLAASPVSVLDIGAGSGVWGIALAHQSPHVTIHAVDWPVVLEVTRSMAQRHGVGDRLRTVAGDLLEADFGARHRVATIGHILHSEGRERSRQLLRKTFAALAPGGTIVISEFIPNDDRSGPPTPLIFAVNMLLHTAAGDAFTFAEIADWLREAAFANARSLEAPSPSPLVLATRP
jgi:2-polyprenyl-3-methyl-5-hydroxy-6-metoxy-1,4-benzoquinol methylase